MGMDGTGGDCAIVTVLLCKREAVWRRSVGQLMRRSGRVNQLTSGPSTHPSTSLASPLPAPAFARRPHDRHAPVSLRSFL